MNASEAALFALLRDRYAPPEWALLAQVADQTGGARSTADALAMNLWRSRGYALHAFEFKATRSDLYRELKNPRKAEHVGRYCDHFWIVAGTEHVIGGDREIPEAWGVLVAQDGKLRQVRAAGKLEAVPLNRAFLAAVLRRVHEQATGEALIREERGKAYQEGFEAARKSEAWEYKRTRDELERLEGQVSAFEAASGLTLSRRTENGAEIGEAVRIVNNLRSVDAFGGVVSLIRRAAQNATEASEGLESAAGELCRLLDLDKQDGRRAEAFKRLTGGKS